MNVSLLAVATELAARGVDVDLFTRAVDSFGTAAIAPGVTLHALPAGPVGEVSKGKLPDLADEFGESVARMVGQATPPFDIIHAHYWLSGIATLPAALGLGVPFVQSFHTLAAVKNAHTAPGDDVEPQRRVLSERYLANQADAIVAGSAFEATSLIDVVGAPAERVWVVPPGVDLALFAPRGASEVEAVRVALSANRGQKLLALVGRIQPLKGHDLAIRALAAMPQPRPLLALAGESTPGAEGYRAELQSLAGSLGVAGNVRFLGALTRSEVAELFSAADLTLIPSHSETFGLVALESAASGTPVVAAATTGLLESVSPGESGVSIDSREPAEWARVISAMLADDRALAGLSVSARTFAEAFSWGASATGLLGLYASLLRP